MSRELRSRRRPGWGWAVLWLFSVVCVSADPIAPQMVGPGLLPPAVIVPVVLAILLEAVCIWLLLRKWRHPRFFILWLMGMHLFTYPIFLGWLWLAYTVRPVVAAAVGEGFIVLLEGALIYLMCQYLSSRKSQLAVPSLSRSLLASLAGNICSAAMFPVLMLLRSGAIY